MKIGDKAPGVVTLCHPDTDLATAAALMSANDCGVLAVLNEAGELAGMVTDRDICIALATRNCRPSELTARDVLRAGAFPRGSPGGIRLTLPAVGSAKTPRPLVITEQWLG